MNAMLKKYAEAIIERLQQALDAAASLDDLREIRDYARILTNLLQSHNLTR
ncbi:MAG: hypothetical protein P9L94_05785 [Candidatus Hinthialibacter antarcticus]|nr:hypothetical protein [Candidatus Hinthialibacter antarcticus]